MPDEFFSGVARAIQHLHLGKDRVRAETKELDPGLALLREWQANRLKFTYRDLLEDRRYRPACEFFLNEVYAARDFTSRDQDIEHLYQLAARFIPEQFLALFKALVELNRMTSQLDNTLLQVLIEKLGMKTDLTAEMYAQAYQFCDNFADRKYQIELLAAVIHDVGAGARDPLIWPTLQVARIPAGLGGWNEMYDFAVHGYQAFRAMRHPEVFANAIETREMQILERIYAGHPDPFALSKLS